MLFIHSSNKNHCYIFLSNSRRNCLLLQYLKIKRCRIYSIASSLDYTKEVDGSEGKMFVDLLVTVVEYTVEGQKTKVIKRKGFCSNYLADLEIGSDVSMYLRSSPSMHLPESSGAKRPLLLGIIYKFTKIL